jgi:hypothetical protein
MGGNDGRMSTGNVACLMRENAWLSPHRQPQGMPTLHDGTITTARFNRALKEQVIHRRLFSNVEEVHTAVAAFKGRYDRRRSVTLQSPFLNARPR